MRAGDGLGEGARRSYADPWPFVAGPAALAVLLTVWLGGLDRQTAAAQTGPTASLIQVIDASAFNPPSPDTAGIAYIDSEDRLLVTDSEVNEMPIFTGDNVFEVTRVGVLFDTFTTIAFSDEPTGIAYNPANQNCFISDDDDARTIYVIDPGSARCQHRLEWTV